MWAEEALRLRLDMGMKRQRQTEVLSKLAELTDASNFHDSPAEWHQSFPTFHLETEEQKS